MLRSLIAGAALLFTASPAFAAGDGALPTDAFLTGHVQPRHEALRTAATDLYDAAAAYCKAPATADITPVREAYQHTMDGWAGIQHITFGPIGDFNRRFRLQFWPDPRSVLDRELAGLVKDRPTDILEEYGFTFASVAIQGLPMVERLIYGEGAEALAEGTDEAVYRCRLLTAVAANVATIAGGLNEEWHGEEGWPAAFRDPVASDLVGDHKEVAGLVLTGLTSQLQSLRDQRLLPVLGGSLEQAAPAKAEAVLSGRSLRGIVVSLEALDEAFDLLFLPSLKANDAKLADLMQRAFAQTLETARGIPGPLDAAVTDPAQRPAVETLTTEIRALQQLLATRVATALGITLGFNSLDGD